MREWLLCVLIVCVAASGVWAGYRIGRARCSPFCLELAEPLVGLCGTRDWQAGR